MATYNGVATLPAVLDAYCRLDPPAQPWQLVIVDNGSNDGSAALVAAYAARLPLRCLHQPQRGKNAALNLALEVVLGESNTLNVLSESSQSGQSSQLSGPDRRRGPGGGDLLIFTDDDATPDRDWLRQWEACARAHPDYAVFGGAIVPDWAQPPPEWLPRLAPTGLTFGLTAPSLPDGPVFPGLVWGANMAVRRGAFDAGYRFDTTVGPNGVTYAMGSETELTRRLALAGYRAWHCAGARVAHHIRAGQMRTAYVLKKAWRFGRGKYLQDRPGTFPELLGLPRWMLSRYVLEWARLARAALRRDRDDVFLRRWELAYLHGYFHQARKGRRPTRGAPKNILVTSYSGELGGMELRMAQEVRYLQANGYRAGLALRRFAGVDAWAQRLADEQISVAEFDPPLFFEQWEWRRLNLWRARLLTARRLRAFRADLVHVALCWTNYGASVLWLAGHCRLPTVLSVHNAFPAASFNAWQRPLLKQAFGGVRGIYAVSDSAMAHFLTLYRPYILASTRLAVIPNSVDTQRFRPSGALRLAARTRMRLPHDALVIGSVARLSEQKQPGAALAMLVLLRKIFPNLYLVLAGSGPLEADLRRQADRTGVGAYVVFTGFVAAVEELLPAFDVHMLLSRNEGFGISTIEAMACGVPVVATDVPGSADILRGSEGGILIPDGDLKNSVPMVAGLLIDPERRAAMGRRGREEVEQRYSEAVVGRLVHNFYQGLL
jgi:glycosyltransferase involved in cell wall biosynthesis